MKRYSDSVADNTLLVSQNVTNLMDDIRAEDLLNDAVYYIDARDASASGQTIDNLGTAKELLPTTLGSSTSADSNDPKYLSWSGSNYVYLPGVASNYLSTPDAAALDITGDLDLRAYVMPDSAVAGSGIYQQLIAKWQTTSTKSYAFGIYGAGFIFYGSTNGTTTSASAFSTTSTTWTAPQWVRATFTASTGTVRFYTSPDNAVWTQIGADVTSGITSLYSSTSQVEFGSLYAGTAQLYSGKIYRAQIFNGIDGTKVLDVDTSVLKTGAETSFTALTGQTVTINRLTSGRKTVAVTQPCWLFGTDDYMEVNNRYMSSGTYLYLPGVSGNYVSSPDSAALDITGDIDIRAKVAFDDWTPAANTVVISKYTSTGNQRSYRLMLLTTGFLQLQFSLDGTTGLTVASTVVTSLSDGATKWVRVTRVAATGVAQFFTSDDGTNWTQLGVDVTGTSGNFYSGTAQLEIGSWLAGTGDIARGKFFRAQVFNGIDGTKVFDADFENKITSLEQASFTEASSNAATVTINRSGSTYRSAGITAAGYLYPGATNTFSASATDFLNFGAADSLTFLASVRYWGTPAGSTRVVFKGSTGPRYGVLLNSTTASFLPFDGTNTGNVSTNLPVAGSQAVYTGILNRATGLSSIYSNTTSNSISASAIGSLLNIDTLRVGSGVSAQYLDGEIYAAAVFRRALTSAEITLITNYFNRRSL